MTDAEMGSLIGYKIPGGGLFPDTMDRLIDWAHLLGEFIGGGLFPAEGVGEPADVLVILRRRRRL